MTWYERPEIDDVLSAHEQAVQAVLDVLEVPEHTTACRQARDFGGVRNEGTTVVVCQCGYVRWFATRELALAIAKYHGRTGEEL